MKKFIRPPEIMFAQSMAFSIGELTCRRDRNDGNGFYNPLNRKMLCGYVVPDFQRGIVWSDDQCLAFIDSAWRGIGLGTYAVNFSAGKRLPPKLRNIIIDGQQRLSALERYFSDELAYRGHKWSQLERVDQMKFESIIFGQMRTNSTNEAEIREYYNCMNFGGTAHTEEDRA